MDYSVLMCVYHKDSPDFLRTAVDSMLSQTVPCEQFVIVQDGPLGEDLQSVIDEYTAKYPDLFTIVPLEQNCGLGIALQRGMDVCRNEMVARMDADDISLPYRIEKQLALFEANPELCLAGSSVNEFYEDPAQIESSRVVPEDFKSIRKFGRRRNPFNHPTVMFKKSAVMRCGGYADLKKRQDFDLFSRMINQGCYAMNIAEPLLLFRSNRDNYKRRKSWSYCRGYIDVMKLNRKRGYCSRWDVFVVTFGQMVMYLSPEWLMKLLSDKFLRKKNK